jgi:serine protease SohB
MEFIYEYGLFLAKAVTVVIAIAIVLSLLIGMRMREKHKISSGHIEVRYVNDKLQDMRQSLLMSVLDKFGFKQYLKEEKNKAKAEEKARKKAAKAGKSADAGAAKKKVYVLDFDGDIRAQEVDNLREEITAVLSVAKPQDEVVVRLESPGGMVHGYGLAASQLRRIRDKNLRLTVCVDKVAASGGYMMACVADRILSAPFAVIGSIGVMAQLPNFNRLLKKHDIDYELLTAGEYKRTLTVLGENTPQGRKKFQQELDDTHELFKAFVKEHRPILNVAEVATGEIWYGQRALDRKLVDALQTSDTFITELCADADVYEIRYVEKKPLQERIGLSLQTAADRFIQRWLDRLSRRPTP